MGGSASLHAGIPPPRTRHPLPGADTPLDQAPPLWTRHPLGLGTPWTRHPPDQASPRPGTPWTRHPPLRSACWEIWSTSRRYASYWNAILFTLDLITLKYPPPHSPPTPYLRIICGPHIWTPQITPSISSPQLRKFLGLESWSPWFNPLSFLQLKLLVEKIMRKSYFLFNEYWPIRVDLIQFENQFTNGWSKTISVIWHGAFLLTTDGSYWDWFYANRVQKIKEIWKLRVLKIFRVLQLIRFL